MLQAVAGAKQQPKPWEILLTDCRINGESADRSWRMKNKLA